MTTLELVSHTGSDSSTTDLTDPGTLRIPRFRPAFRHAAVPFLTSRHATPARPQEVRWLPEVKDEIRSYMELAPNWDSYGGGPVQSEIAEAAVEFARLMALYGFSRPKISPESSGGILMEWEHRNRALTVDLDETEGFSFGYESPGQPESEGGFEDFVTLLNVGVQPL